MKENEGQWAGNALLGCGILVTFVASMTLKLIDDETTVFTDDIAVADDDGRSGRWP